MWTSFDVSSWLLPSIGICQTRLGWRPLHKLSGGVELALRPLATKQSTATTEVTLCDGHDGTKTLSTISADLALNSLRPPRPKFHGLSTPVQPGLGLCEKGSFPTRTPPAPPPAPFASR